MRAKIPPKQQGFEEHMSEQNIIRWLHRYGHFFSPSALDIGRVDEMDIDKLRLSDAEAHAAMRNAQRYFGPQIKEGRAAAGVARITPEADGDPGVGFAYLMTIPRCGMPDFTDPAITLEGRYAPACLGQLVMAHRFGDKVDASDETIVRRNLIEWIEGADMEIVRAQSSPVGAHFWEIIQNQGGNVLARHMLQQGISCRRTEGWYDPRSFSTQGMRTAVWTHEVGHGLGMPHTSARDPDTGELATLNPTIHFASQRRNGRFNKADHAVLSRLGYDVTDKPRDVDEPTPGGDEYRVTISVTDRTFSFNNLETSKLESGNYAGILRKL